MTDLATELDEAISHAITGAPRSRLLLGRDRRRPRRPARLPSNDGGSNLSTCEQGQACPDRTRAIPCTGAGRQRAASSGEQAAVVPGLADRVRDPGECTRALRATAVRRLQGFPGIRPRCRYRYHEDTGRTGLRARLRQLKSAAEHDMRVGGADLAGQAIKAGLADEVRLFLVPVVVGGGKRALPTASAQIWSYWIRSGSPAVLSTSGTASSQPERWCRSGRPWP
jgi:hypothetical protein